MFQTLVENSEWLRTAQCELDILWQKVESNSGRSCVSMRAVIFGVVKVDHGVAGTSFTPTTAPTMSPKGIGDTAPEAGGHEAIDEGVERTLTVGQQVEGKLK